MIKRKKHIHIERIHLDFDEVLSDTYRGVAHKIFEKEGSSFTLTQMDYWDYISDDNVYAKHGAPIFMEKGEFLRYAQPIKGADRFVNRLQKTYAEESVYVLTAGDPLNGEKDYIINEWVNIPLGQAIYDSQKYRHATKKSVLVDDKPGNLVEYVNQGGYGILLNLNGEYGWSNPETINWSNERTVKQAELADMIIAGHIKQANSYEEAIVKIAEINAHLAQKCNKKAILPRTNGAKIAS